MAEPARRGADGPGPDDDPERKPDPRAGGWADVRNALAIDSRAVALAASEVAAHPGDHAALSMLELTVRVMESLGVIAGRCAANEAVIENERKRGFDEGYAACRAGRCRLGVIDGGRAG